MGILRNLTSIVFALALALDLVSIAHSDTAAFVPVPFVGCASDGQLGPLPAPTRGREPPTAPLLQAPELAFYASADLGVLAPRGWHCIGLYGSNGAILIVTPEPQSAGDLLGPRSNLNGPAIQLNLSYGDTSGRFEVAKVAARLFPAKKDIVRRVIAEGIEPASAFPTGPFPADTVKRLSDSEVEFETPPNEEGMGTQSRLNKNSDPISGLAVLTRRGDLVLLDVRLLPALRGLVSAIVADTREYSGVFPLTDHGQ